MAGWGVRAGNKKSYRPKANSAWARSAFFGSQLIHSLGLPTTGKTIGSIGLCDQVILTFRRFCAK